MSGYTVTITPSGDQSGPQTTIQVDTASGAARVTELTVKAGGNGLSAQELPVIDLALLVAALAPTTAPAITAAPAPAPAAPAARTRQTRGRRARKAAEPPAKATRGRRRAAASAAEAPKAGRAYRRMPHVFRVRCDHLLENGRRPHATARWMRRLRGFFVASGLAD